MKQSTSTIAVLGDGAWGTATATLLANNGHRVSLWCYDADVARLIAQTRRNERYLPGFTLDDAIVPTTNIREAVCGVQWVFEAIPVKFLRTVLSTARDCYEPQQTWVVLSKGIEQDTLLLPSDIIDDVFGCNVSKAVMSGPSYAHDLACKQITAVTIAASDCETANALQALLANDYFRPYVTLDMIGAQAGGALKNVITLGVGMLDGAGYTDNAKAFLLTRGFDEMVRLAVALGGTRETLYGLSGIGDLVLTATGKLSRNAAVGKRLGAGEPLDAIVQHIGSTPEGINTIIAVNQLAQKLNLELPICNGLHRVIFEGLPLAQMLDELMNRPLERECEARV